MGKRWRNVGGYAVTWWSDDEVGDADPEELIDRAVAAGNDYLNEEVEVDSTD